MAKQKPIQVTERTHEILRREALNLSVEKAENGNSISMGDILNDLAEQIQVVRKFEKLPEPHPAP